MKITKIISSAIEKGILIIKVLGYGNSDVQTITNITPFGIDARPPKGYRGIYADTSSNEDKILIGVISEKAIAEVGEIRFHSEDSDGIEKAFLYLKENGEIHLNGDADNAMRFLNTKDVIDEIQSDIADLKQVFSTWVTVPNDGGAALKTASATWAGTPLTENIDDSKIDEIKTN